MNSSPSLRATLVSIGILFFSLTGCSRENTWPMFPIIGYPLQLINHTPDYFSDRTVMLKSSVTSPRTRYELEDYNPDHSSSLFILEVLDPAIGPAKYSDKIKAHIVADGFKYRMNHVLQEGISQGAGIWTFKLPPSDDKMSSNMIPYYFVVEQMSGASENPIQEKLGSAEEPFTVKLAPAP